MSITKTRNRAVTKKRKTAEDIYYPVPEDFNPIRAERPLNNKEVVKRIIQGAVRLAYSLKPPKPWDYNGNATKLKVEATSEQMEMVMHLVESLQPADAIEAALASQFVVTYIRAMEATSDYGSISIDLELFEFGHQALEALQKYRSRGAQQINVQYNVNQGQVVNIKNVKKDDQPVTLDGASA